MKCDFKYKPLIILHLSIYVCLYERETNTILRNTNEKVINEQLEILAQNEFAKRSLTTKM